MFSDWFWWYQFFIMMFNALWITTYVLALRQGYKDKAPPIPLFSLSLNLAWDIIGSFFLESPGFQFLINMSFTAFNLAFTWQWFCYWRNVEGFKRLSKYEFYGFWALAQVVSLAAIWLGNTELRDLLAYKIGFIDNFINSILFIAMLYNRSTLSGQSLPIAITKMLGTASMSMASILFTPAPLADSVILYPLYAGILFFDVLYVVLLLVKRGKLKTAV